MTRLKPKSKLTNKPVGMRAIMLMDQVFTAEADEINRAKMLGAMYKLAQDLESMLQAAEARRDREGIA